MPKFLKRCVAYPCSEGPSYLQTCGVSFWIHCSKFPLSIKMLAHHKTKLHNELIFARLRVRREGIICTNLLWLCRPKQQNLSMQRHADSQLRLLNRVRCSSYSEIFGEKSYEANDWSPSAAPPQVQKFVSCSFRHASSASSAARCIPK